MAEGKRNELWDMLAFWVWSYSESKRDKKKRAKPFEIDDFHLPNIAKKQQELDRKIKAIEAKKKRQREKNNAES